MGMLDMKTILFSFLISDLVGTLVMFMLFAHNGRQFSGAKYWIINFILQTCSIFLILIRGNIPDWISMVVANAMVITGVFMGLIGLQKFLHIKSHNIFNYLLVIAFVLIHYWFSVIKPDLGIRNLNVSIAMLVLCFQCSWLLIYRAPPDFRKIVFGVGLIFAIYCIVNLSRIFEYIFVKNPSNDYLDPGHFEKIVIYSYQTLFLLLTFSLTLMVNRTLKQVLEVEEEKFSKAFQSSPYLSLVTRFSDGVILEVNDMFCQITGYAKNEVIGKTNNELQLWKDPDERQQAIAEIVANDKIIEKEYRFKKKSGEDFIALFSAELVKVNNVPCFLASLNDITQKKRAEEKLLESNRKLQTLINNLNGIAYRCLNDREWTMEYISDGVFELTGYPATDFIQNQKRSFNSIIHPDDQEFIWNIIQKVIQEKKAYILTYRILTSINEIKWVWERGRAVFEYEKLVALEGFISDITERKLAEDEVHRLNAELEARVFRRTLDLEEKTAELEAFTYSVSHDLRAPLRAINGFSKILLENYSKAWEEDAKKLFDHVIGNTKKMGNLIDDLLTLSRLDKHEIKTTVIDMQSMVNAVINELISNQDKEHIEIILGDLPSCEADPSMIHQIWINLISNAIKFTSKKEAPKIEIGFLNSNHENVYTIKDNGVGFNEKYSERLFRVFQRLHSEKEFEGTGVGLAIVKRTIHRLGGKVWAESKMNEGATFYFSIPV
jgi:PAS domain S-box-containing protein